MICYLDNWVRIPLHLLEELEGSHFVRRSMFIENTLGKTYPNSAFQSLCTCWRAHPVCLSSLFLNASVEAADLHIVQCLCTHTVLRCGQNSLFHGEVRPIFADIFCSVSLGDIPLLVSQSGSQAACVPWDHSENPSTKNSFTTHTAHSPSLLGWQAGQTDYEAACSQGWPVPVTAPNRLPDQFDAKRLAAISSPTEGLGRPQGQSHHLKYHIR